MLRSAEAVARILEKTLQLRLLVVVGNGAGENVVVVRVEHRARLDKGAAREIPSCVLGVLPHVHVAALATRYQLDVIALIHLYRFAVGTDRHRVERRFVVWTLRSQLHLTSTISTRNLPATMSHTRTYPHSSTITISF